MVTTFPRAAKWLVRTVNLFLAYQEYFHGLALWKTHILEIKCLILIFWFLWFLCVLLPMYLNFLWLFCNLILGKITSFLMLMQVYLLPSYPTTLSSCRLYSMTISPFNGSTLFMIDVGMNGPFSTTYHISSSYASKYICTWVF